MENKFSVNLERLRTAQHMSQTELAKQISVTQQAVVGWENGEGTPDLEHLIKLADLFQVSLDELITADGSYNQSNSYHINNGWDWLARYWWVIFGLIALLTWAIPNIVTAVR